MSNTIDQRVVEMRFDNSQFEQNVSTTMTTLEKLKQKLNLSGATKGLSDVDSAARKVDMSGLGSAVETVSAKFSALQVMGVTALANITNSAVNAGKRIVKSLTIDPIKTGFEEYETKMGSIQTILANTEHQGTTLNDVTKALDELNTYADKTIYNFQQMTKNIGTFTAAGVSLDTSVRSIQGIANLAAVSGSTSQQASTAMYQLSQALASGTVKLMDWNSVVNAGMGGKVFQNALIRTAAMLDGSAKDVEKWQKEHIDAYGSFRESLTKDAWLTAEVLTTTLEQFTMAAEEGSAEWEAFKKSLLESGYTEKQAEDILKMANTATDAATKVKTFTQLMDTLKESAQSGWAQSWELIIGDFEEAKAFFTDLSDLFGGIISDSAASRNSLLGDALMSNWDKLINKINEAGVETTEFEESIRKAVGDEKLDPLVERFGSLENVIKNGAISSEDLITALDNISDTSADSKLSSIVNGLREIDRALRRGSVGEDVKALQTALDALGYNLGKPGIDGIIGPITERAIKEFQKANGLIADGVVGSSTLKALEEANSKVDDVEKNVSDLKTDCADLIDVLTKKSGRELLLDSVMNIIKAIHRPLSAIGEAWNNVFAITPDQLYGAIESLNRFTSSFVMDGILDATTWAGLIDNIKSAGIESTVFESKLKETLEKHNVDVDKLIEKYGNLGKAFEDGVISKDIIKETLLGFDGITESLLVGGETADKVRRSFEGLFAIVDIIATVMSGPIKVAFNVASKVLSKFGIGILDVTAGIGDGLVKFRDKVDENIESVSDFIADNIVSWISEFKETEFFKTCAGWISEASQTISEALSNVSDHIESFDTSVAMERLREFAEFLTDIGEALANSEVIASIVDAVCGAFAKLKQYIPKIKVPEFNVNNLKKFSNLMSSTFEGTDITNFNGMLNGFSNYFKGVASYNWERLKNKSLEKFVSFWLKVGDGVKAAFDKCKEVALALKKFLFGTEELNFPVIMDTLQEFLKILLIIQAFKVLQNFTNPFENITDAFNNFASALKWDAIANAFKSMALAIGVFALCIYAIVSIGDMGKAWQATVMLVLLLAAMGGVAAALAFLSTKIGGGINTAGAAASLLLIVASVLLLMRVLKEMDTIDPSTFVTSMMKMVLVLGALTAGVGMVALAGKSSFKSVAAILTLVAALKLILEVIDAYEAYDWSGKEAAIARALGMLVALSVAINIASRGVKENASAKGLALTLLAMVVSLKILVGVITDFAAIPTEDIIKGGFVVIALLGVMSLIAFALGKASGGMKLEKGQKAVNHFTGLAVALLAVVAAIWLLGKMDLDTLKQGGFAVGQVLILFAAMLFAVGTAFSGVKIGAIYGMLIAIALLLAEITAIVWLMQKIPAQQSIGTAVAIGGLLLAMALALKTLTKYDVSSGNIYKWVGAMALLGLVVGALGFILASMKNVQPANAIGSAAALSLLLGAMALALKTLTKYDVYSGNLYNWVGAMAVLALVVAGLGFVLASMQKLQPANAIGSAAALSILIIAMAGVLKILNIAPVNGGNIGGWIGAMAGLTIVVYALANILAITKDIDPKSAIGNMTALSILLVAMAGTLAVINHLKVGIGAVDGIIALAAIAGTLAGLVYVLSKITGVENARVNALTLAGLAIALSAALIPLAVAGKIAVTRGMVPGVLALVAIGYALGLLIQCLSTITGVETARENAISLAGLALALSVALIPLAFAGTLTTATGGVGLLAGVIALAVVAAVLGTLVCALSAITDVETARANAITLTGLAIALTACVAALSVVGLLVPGVIAGTTALVTIAGILALIVWGLSAIDDIDKARSNAETLIGLAASLTSLIMALSLAGADALDGVEALGDLIGLITRIGALAVAVGALVEWIPAIEDFIDSGIEVFVKLAEGLGEIVNAFFTGLTDDLSTIGDNLSGFALSAETFINTVRSIDGDVATGAANLVSAITDLLAIDTSDMSLDDLGDELTKFAENAEGFMTAIGTIDVTAANALTGLFDSIKKLTTIETDGLDDLGEEIEDFATCINSASQSLAGITEDDVANIKRAATAGEAMSALAKSLPAVDGAWQQFAGTKSLSDFGTTMVDFGNALVEYSASVSGQNIDTKAIEASAAAGTKLSDLANSLPAVDGYWQKFVGTKSLSDFGTTLVQFAGALVSYSEAVSGETFDTAAIENSAAAAKKLADVESALPATDGKLQDWVGSKDIGTFGSGLKSLGEGIANYATAVAEIDDTVVTDIETSGKAIDALVLVMDKIPEVGGWGSKIFGETDGQGFSAGITALATSLGDFTRVASTINDTTIGSITKAGEAVDSVVAVVKKVPDDVDLDSYADEFSGAVRSLKTAFGNINDMLTAGYDFTGISNLETGLTSLSTMMTNVDTISFTAEATALKFAVGQVEDLTTSLANISTADFTGVTNLATAIDTLGGVDVDSVITAFAGKSEAMYTAVNSLVEALVRGLSSGADQIAGKMEGIASSMAAGIESGKDAFKTAGETLADSLEGGLSGKTKDITTAGENLGNDGSDGAEGANGAFVTAGSNLGSGLIAGINAKVLSAYMAGYALGAAAARGVNAGMDAHSPSRESMKSGRWLGEGLVIGIKKMSGSVYNAGSDMAKGAVRSISDSIGKVSEIVENGIDAQPTIRPVLDLSDVRAGASGISSLFNSNSSIGVMANVGAISSMMGHRGQNGDSEIVDAINKLRKDIGNMGGTSYTIGDITYDDGSNVSGAVKALVREARMERRR